ncbi:MAG: anti-sigma factor domain-containing protein [Microcoleaceae cyanobacterium]
MPELLSEDQQALAAGYVLEDLNPEELRQVEQLLQTDSDFQREVRAIQTSLDLLPTALPEVEPPAELQERILAAFVATTENATLEDTELSVTDSTTERPEKFSRSQFPQPQRPDLQVEPRPSITWRNIITWVTTFIAIALAVDNFWLRQQWKVAREVNLERLASILQQPNSRLIALEGAEGSQATGTLLFTKGRWKEVIISLGDLPPLPPDQVYRMWLSLDNGEAIFCGQFETDEDGSVFIRLNPQDTPSNRGAKATGLFVTIEARDEAPVNPSGQQVMFGEV